MKISDFLSWNDFIAGWVSGISAIIIGHPMETIKVRQQTMPNFGPMKHTVNTLKIEGVKGLYKGMSYPLWTSGILSSVYFGLYGNSLRMIETYKGQEHYRTCCDNNTPAYKGWHTDCFIAGCIAGIAATAINTPIELAKTILQSQIECGDKKSKRIHLTPTSCLLTLFRHKGIAGCFHGGIILMIRDVPTYGLYAVCYEHILCILRRKEHSNIYLRVSQEGFAGGCSGVITWAIAIPLDVIKSRYMSDAKNIPNCKYNGILDCVVKTYKAYGITVFYKGFWITILRAFPVNLICFVTYEQSLKICKYI